MVQLLTYHILQGCMVMGNLQETKVTGNASCTIGAAGPYVRPI